MNRWRIDPVNVITLAISAGLLTMGYLLDLFATQTLVVALLLLAAVSIISASVASVVCYRSQRALAQHIANSFSASFLELQNKTSQSLERVETATFNHLIAYRPDSASGPKDGSEIAAITRTQATAIESASDEVWIYAYNMAWDADQRVLGQIVETNLREGVKYRFLLPDRPEVRARARVISNRWRNIPDITRSIQFRIRHEEPIFGKFGICLYNPSYEKAAEELNKIRVEPCVILFPNFGRVTPGEGDPFIKIRGPVVSEYELEFTQTWQVSTVYIPEPLDGYESVTR